MAYARVASLMRTMESVLHPKSPMQSLISDHREEVLALHEKVSCMEVFLKNFEKDDYSGKMTDLDAQIKEVANIVEHVIQLRLAEGLMADDMQKKEAHRRLRNSLQQVAEEIDHVYKESTKLQDKGKSTSNKPLVQHSSSEKEIPDVKKINMVGRDGERKRLIKDLTRCYSGETEVIPIVGMGGIGKTTLAEEVYNDASIRSHFDVCAWATISQQHNVKEILLSLLRSTEGNTSQTKDESELADMLQKSLKGKRYLVIMDDMWSRKAWDDVRQCFTSQNNASRILLTTRNSTEVARYAGTNDLSVQMDFMDSHDSWNLFKSAAFSNETLPSELKIIGKQIVDKCQGLPLSIVVVSGLLSKLKRTKEVWETVAGNVLSFVTTDPNERCFNVLGLSYNHLPGNLKACLLYFGIFPEGEEISVKRLVRLWICEGFLKLEKDMEGQAEKCLQDLIDRCLVLVSKKSEYQNKIISCKVHDVIYEMCLKEAQSQNLFIMKEIVLDKIVGSEFHYPEDGDVKLGSCRAVITPGCHHLIMGQSDVDDDNALRQTRSIFSFCQYDIAFTLPPEITHFNLLKILDLSHIELNCFPQHVLHLIWLRYLVFLDCKDGIPPEIYRLWNLQTLIDYGVATSTFSEQIWQLTQLRHLSLSKFYLPNPPSVSIEEARYLGFSEVHTIKGLSPSSCTKEVILGIRNVKKLGIHGEEYDYESFQEHRLFNSLVHLHQLETLSFILGELSGCNISPVTIPSAKAFPATLTKLKLSKTHLRWEDLNIIGELPNLEVLKLGLYACDGEEWYPNAGGFTKLKVLKIGCCLLKYWKATSDNFPALEHLFIEDCSDLEEIPIEFVEIYSLQFIDLYGCSRQLNDSAIQIRQEQEDLGNKPVHVRIRKPFVEKMMATMTMAVAMMTKVLFTLTSIKQQ